MRHPPRIATISLRATITLALAAFWLAIPSTESAPAHTTKKHATTCLPRNGKIVTADSKVAVYLAPEDKEYPEFLGVYGCSYKTGRSYHLGPLPPAVATPSGDGGVRKETVAGAFVACEEGSGGNSTGAAWEVTVINLDTDKVLYSRPSGTPSHPKPLTKEGGVTPHYVGIGPIEALVVKSNGSVAWIVQTTQEEGSYQLHVLNREGERILASGPELEPHSLALTGSTLYWLEAGKPFSATLN